MNLSNKKFANGLVLAISLAALILPLAVMVAEVLNHNGGIYSYPLDDSYIHLAVAKNLSQNNVWGISGHEFASAASSILFPLLLAAIFKVFGVYTIIPFIINFCAAIIFIIVAQKWLIRQGVGFYGQLLILLLTIFLAPLPVMVMVGMEHILHLLFFLLFLTSFSSGLESMRASQNNRPNLKWSVYLYAFLLMATRFESMALVLVACGILAYYKFWPEVIKLGVISFIPVIAFGIFSVSKGGFFMPNSVVLKSIIPGFNAEEISWYMQQQFFPRFFTNEEQYNTLGVQRLLLILPLVYLVFRRSIIKDAQYSWLLIMLMACTIFHISFMTFSFYGRYETYLVASSVLICSTLFVKYSKVQFNGTITMPQVIGGLFGIILFAPVVTRSLTVFNKASLGAIWTYDQQYQMGQFVHKYYDNDGVVFNDIGAVSYFSEGKKVDILGLGNNDIGKMRKAHLNSPAYIDSLSRKRNIKIAIVYEPRFRKYMLGWQKVASWDIPWEDPISFYDSVTFYSLNSSDVPSLRENLKQYQASLPKEIVVKYY